MPANSEITATYLTERMRFDSMVIASARLVNGSAAPPAKNPFIDTAAHNNITIKGEAEPTELKPGLPYRFLGHWSDYENRRTNQTEKQFHFHSFVLSEPHGKNGLIRYLQNAGLSPGRANTLHEIFGDEAVAKMRDNPDECCSQLDKRFTPAQAAAVSSKLKELKRVEHVLIDVIDLLAGRHFRKKTPMLCVKKWGEKAPSIIRRNPYALMELPGAGAGFKLCDTMYCELFANLPAKLGSIKRQALCAWNALHRPPNDHRSSNDQGHTWHPIGYAVNAIKGAISGTDIQPERALRLAKRSKRIAVLRTDYAGNIVSSDAAESQNTRLYIAEFRRAQNERYIAEKLASLMRSSVDKSWPDIGKIKGISEHQAAGLSSALTSPVACFIGGPGTGKSYVTGRLAETLVGQYGHNEIAFAAPTNKAAVRLSAALEQTGLKATSTHRMLGVQSVDGGNWRFAHYEENPLPFKVVCLDEGSMYNTDLFASVLRACAVGTKILIIGDIHQLPPIQHGAPLRDMLAANIPFGELTEPQRNAGDIVFACNDIRQGKRFSESDQIDLSADPPKNFKFSVATSPQQQIEKLLMLMAQMKHLGLDPIWDCQVMTPLNTKSDVSRKAINELLQRELNGGGIGPSGSPFKTGDKVQCEDNGEYSLVGGDSGDEKVFIAKGEIGRVTDSQPKIVTVKFESPNRTVKFPRGTQKDSPTNVSVDSGSDAGGESGEDQSTNTGCALQLCYATTIHKLQGSETALAVPIIDESAGARRLGSRELFYTSISRGKKLTVPIGRRETADAMCKKQSLPGRRTFLKELLQMELKR